MHNGFLFFVSVLKRERVVCPILLNSASYILIVLALTAPFSLLGMMFYRSRMVNDLRFSEFIGTK